MEKFIAIAALRLVCLHSVRIAALPKAVDRGDEAVPELTNGILPTIVISERGKDGSLKDEASHGRAL